MPSLRRLTAVVIAMPVLVLAFSAAPAHANANVAALQVALKALKHYGGPIDGITGPKTRRAVRRFQRAHRLQVDGVAGPATRRALGRRGRPSIGSRIMKRGQRGWDVAGLQYMLKRRGISTSIDGGFGPGTEASVKRFQRARGLAADGRAGRSTLSALKRRSSTPRQPSGSGSPSGPVSFFRPVNGPIGDGFGYRWGRMHTGLDFPVAAGTRVGAAGRGVTSFAGWNSGGYGNLVIIKHRLGFETWYAHLASITTWPGENVVGGTRIGYVGSTGRSTGPHLHWEVRHNGVPIDPRTRLLNRALPSAASATPLECGPLGERPEDARSPRPLPGYESHARTPLRPCR